MVIELVVEELEDTSKKGMFLYDQLNPFENVTISVVPKEEAKNFEIRLHERTKKFIGYEEKWEAESLIKAQTMVLGSSRIIGYGSLVYRI